MSEDVFSPAQVAQLEDIVDKAARKAVRDEMADSGLRLDGPDHVEENRKDFQFTRSLRKTVSALAEKVGWFVIAAILGGIVFLVQAGFNIVKGN